jgi:hypothetical protein
MRTAARKGNLLKMLNNVTTTNTKAYVQIVTRQGVKEVVLDIDDLIVAEELARLVLYKDPKGREMARAGKEDNQVLLHRHLFEIPKGSRLEWINEDTLDLRRENLQLVDREGNITLLKEPKEVIAPPTIKGVTFHRHSQRWNSRPYWGSDRYSLGYFKTKEEAEAETRIFLAEGPDSPKLKRNQRKGKN